ncbi:MAG: SpoIIE family protein phosphatase [Bacteroidetes bacterium]|nr:SpoIIE family protein phosphatase [Bacteroidota bacterium]
MKEKELSRETLLEQRRELLASLKYASFIQEAILPSQRYLQNILSDYFLFFKPRDIVSGDFYYCTRKDELIIIAAGDCTGHGVPGALLSIMGVSFLNEILSAKGSCKPATILNLLRERVMNALHQQGKDMENKDAMDMALLVYNTETRELQYSGANNPLYHIRKKVLTEIKANKMPVGINAIEEESFSNHTLQLKQDDIVYIFSDGYADQFGGHLNKKFKYGPMKELLISISDKSMVQQKKVLEQTMKSWMGDESQIDDILVFGVKFV